MKNITALYIAYNSGSNEKRFYKKPVSVNYINAQINAVTRSRAAGGDLIKGVWIIQGGLIKRLENAAALNARALVSLECCPIRG